MDYIGHVYIFVSVILTISEGFTVKGSSGPLVVPLGGSVVLPCSVDSFLSLEDLEVEWRRSDSQTLIHLYQDEDIRPESQHQDYHDRAHFFTEDIKHGNFSLLLNNLKAEDEGQYTCKVHTGQESGETEVEIKHVERLIVSGSSRSIFAYEGDDVTLNCSVDSHIKPEEIEEVSWKKRDKHEKILVLLYQNNEIQSESSDERYRDRVEFFTDEIHRGNFSLRLKRVRTEDKGVYICQVFAGQLSANTTVILERLGFSGLHIMVLILCITACGSALLISFLIYCKSNKPGLKFSVDYSYQNLGASVVLPCFNNKPIPEEGLKVKWSKSGLKSPVCLYEGGDIRPEAQHQDYHERANFFTEDIKHGNFSLLLNNLTTEDEGQYTCTVYSGQESVFSVRVNLKETNFKYTLKYLDDQDVPPGGSVVLPCFNNKPIPEEGLKVKWSKSGLKSPVCLYKDGDIRPEAQHQDYHDRAHFFTEDIKHGNFSLLLNNLTAEDEGQYTCKVYSGQESVFSVKANLKETNFSAKFSVDYSYQNLGASVVLPCFNNKLLPEVKRLKVEWRRSDLERPVCLYEGGNIRPEAQHQDYHDRAHFFTEDIKHGNFSLKLNNLTAEDEGQYTCKVYSGQESVFSVRANLKETNFKYTLKYLGDQVVPPGDSVVLPCFNNKPIPEEGLKVKWSKSGLKSPVCLYKDGDIRPEAQHQDYHDRAHLFTEDFKHGNFSLLLKNLREKDLGEYTCTVYSQELTSRRVFRTVVCSGRTQLVPRLSDLDFIRQMCLVFCPNLIMFLAFIFWGVSEGSVNETICCCALYILRPLTLFWAHPYINVFRGKIKTLILEYSYVAEYCVMTAVVYSVLFTNTLEKLLGYGEFDRVLILIIYVIVFLCCFSKIIYVLAEEIKYIRGWITDIFDIVADLTFEIMPILQFILLFYTFGSASGGFVVIVAVVPFILMITNERMFDKCNEQVIWSREVRRTIWLILTLLLNAVVLCLYILTLENKMDPFGWACVMVFLHVLWEVVRFSDHSYYYSIPLGFHRFVTVYVFGSVGVVLISCLGLMTELILKTINGERAVMDLRFIVFPSECFFVMSVMILGQLDSKIKERLQPYQRKIRSKLKSNRRPKQKRSKPDYFEMKPLLKKDLEAGRRNSF
nr:uncharacterized protein LOC129436718 [Misgurnus anguillicaudatus]